MDDRTTTDFIRPKPAEPATPALDTPVHDKPETRRKSKAGRRFLQLVVLLGLAAAGWWYGHRPQDQDGAAPATTARSGRFNPYANAMPVVTAAAQKGDIDITLDALGTVTSLATVTIKSQISGYLVNVNYQEGQAVKKGDLLAEIDDRPYKLALQNAEGTLARDQAMLRSAELDLNRYNDLVKTNAVPRQQLDQQVATVDQDKANLLSDQAQIDTQKLNIVYCHITAPVNGRVGLRLVDQGNYVTPADATGLVVITQFTPITVIFPVAEDAVPRITQRLKAAKSLPLTAFDRDFKKQLATGELKTVDNQIDTTTGTARMRADFANGDEALYPNQFVNVRVLVDTLKDAIVVPQAAIQRGSPGTFVYKVNPTDQTVTVQKVKLGPSSGERVAIEDGLATGDTVVIDGADKLRSGAKVVPRESGGGDASATPQDGAPQAGTPQNGAAPAAAAADAAPADKSGGGRHRRGGQ